MTATWNQVREVVDAALELPPVARASFLDSHCPEPKLRRYVESLLLSFQNYNDFLEDVGAAIRGADLVSDDRARQSATGKRVGPYRLCEKLGEGGMGTVYRAVRADEQYEKEVAIKLVKSGFASELTIRRFRAERQILANLDHPNVARLFDGGVTEDGIPYFVMELVPGEPIDRYCASRQLSIAERLQLFCVSCAAVQYAHQNLVVHRDLKPSNILVTPEGEPKLLDFGIAKILDSESTPSETANTLSLMRMLTPEYASPEQIRGETITTASDVYSLGVVLYVLLTGRHPYDVAISPASPIRSPQALMKAICELEPPKPSALVLRKVTQADDGSSRAVPLNDLPGINQETLARRLAGDLDTIVLTALNKEPQRRYSSAAALAADIQRYLRNEPILARPPSLRYHMEKFTRRNKAFVAAGIAILVVLIAGIIGSTWEARRARRAERTALGERDRANRISDFMTGMFKVSDPSEARGNSVTAREILEKASKDINAGLPHDPALQAQMMRTMGTVYDGLGLYSHARELFSQAVDIQRRVLGPENQETLVSMQSLAWVLREEGKYPESESTQRSALKIQGRLLGPNHRDTLASEYGLAWTLREEGQYLEAERILRQTFDTQRRVLGAEDSDTLTSMAMLAWTLRDESNFPEAEKMLRETIDLQRHALGAEHPDTLSSMALLGSLLRLEERYDESERTLREVLETRRRVLGPEHPDTLVSTSQLAGTLLQEGHYADAEKMLREILAIQRRTLDPDNPDMAISMYNLACVLVHRGWRNEALSLLQEAIDHGLPPNPRARMANDPDLQALHGDSRFAAIVAQAQKTAEASSASNSSR